MHISATVHNTAGHHHVTVSTAGSQKVVAIPPKTEGFGSSLNGGELLLLSLATCFCNDVYREAPRRNITVTSVEVTVSGEFAKEGAPGTNIVYRATIIAPASTAQELEDLIKHVDKVAEIHNTLRQGATVQLQG